MPRKAKTETNQQVWTTEVPKASSARRGKIQVKKQHIALARETILGLLDACEKDGGTFVRGTLSVY